MLFDQFYSRELTLKAATFFLKGAAREVKGDIAGGGAEKFGADFIPDFLIKMY